MTPGVILTLPKDYIHGHYHSSQTSLLYIFQVSGERLQDHRFSGLFSIFNTGQTFLLKGNFYCLLFSKISLKPLGQSNHTNCEASVRR